MYNRGKTEVLEVLMGKKPTIGMPGRPDGVRWSEPYETTIRFTKLPGGFGCPHRLSDDGYDVRKDNASIAWTGRTAFPAAANR
jgi:hypothetical protein